MRLAGFLAILAVMGCGTASAADRNAARGKLAVYMGLSPADLTEPSAVDCILDRMADNQVHAFLAAQTGAEQSDILGGIQDLNGMATCMQEAAS
ncbi:hypothetical protein Q4555_13845 [Octadecabacter sp. 1_MG-2023]|uniref:hypothetical protein n=1 Tax=unclassified Octadecabacter TaxID=196158 RepID=UPI001C0841ED|nr:MULTISPECIES: hypothetical protein [unclassified Octadecabacter]MBU2991782.1 hypothetical protein [Octadecabacter sp. B2R22]MDO6735755.1 hypothetical protein [Octadecabacter sp. 1_MG-2023]